jgi:hypothetical protein
VKVVNISDPLNLEVADQFETPGLVFNNFTDGNNLYVCDYYDVLILNLYGNGVEKDNSSRVMLESSNLIGAYPNPFNSTTEISYRISQPGRASLKIYDVNGRAVATIFEGSCEPGEYKQKFVADNLSSGIYFATLEIGRTNQTEKIMLLK